jgi:membrane protease YdiL (CAAX protease family)
MAATHALTDHLFVAAILIFSAVEWRWLWPRHVRAVAQGVAGARTKLYYGIMASEWLFTAFLLVSWILQRRRWSSLRLGETSLLPLCLGLLSVAAVIVLLRFRSKALLARPDRIDKLRRRMGFADPLVPATPSELTLFKLVSVTAGICEEIIFRGFLIWYFAAWMGPVPAILASSVVFGFGHIYLSVAHVPRTAVVGVILGFLVLVTGSLWPAIIIHAALDWNSGEAGFHILRQPLSVQPETGLHAEA